MQEKLDIEVLLYFLNTITTIQATDISFFGLVQSFLERKPIIKIIQERKIKPHVPY
jgi:hypothetical protein